MPDSKTLKLALAVTLMLTGVGVFIWRSLDHGQSHVITPPKEFFFHCTTCKAEWETDALEAAELFGTLPNYTNAIDCPKCQAEKSAFAMTPCTWCGEHYLPDYLKPDGAHNTEVDICPHCGKDTFKWTP